MSAPRRRHVTTACLPCRESKVKCDGASPICSSCRTKRKECLYQAGDDKRKLSIRRAVELLSSRIDQLSGFIRAQGLQPPSMLPHDREALMRNLDDLKLLHVLSDSMTTSAQDESTHLTENQRSIGDSALGYSKIPTSTTPKNSDILQSTTKHNQYQSAISPSLGPDLCYSNPLDEPIVIDSMLVLDPSTWPSANLAANNELLQQSYLNFDNSEDPIHLNTPTPSIPGNHMQSTQLPSLPQVDKNTSASAEALIDQLSDRIGSLQIEPSGQVRYYGPTSNFNLVEMPAPDNLTVHRTVRNNGQEHLERLGINKEVPAELQDHLVNLYFAWQNPVFQIVKRKFYQEARVLWREKKQDTPYYSEALENAVCALGAAFEARHHPTFVTFPSSLSDFFANRSKALLEIELDSPCVATVQAMVILSGHDIGCKRDTRGWLYSGMAMRLAFDLALHVDMSPHIANKKLTSEEVEVRKDVFWGAYAVDHTWSFYLGRPFRINMEDVTVSKPSGDPSPGFDDTWLPYVSAKSMNELTPCQDYPNLLLRQRVLMAEIMAPLGYALYGSHKIPSKTLQEMNVKTVDELFSWKANLPPVVQVDPDQIQIQYLPHVILLHMQYYQNLIHAHRPWMSRTYYQPVPPQGPGSDHARMICMDSAYAIAKLLQTYETHYSFRMMNIQGVGITCSAALLLIFATVTNYHREDANDTALHLSTCFRALDEFGPSWENAKRAKDFLVLLQRQWELQGRSAKARRVSPTAPSDPVSSKRTRTTNSELGDLEQPVVATTSPENYETSSLPFEDVIDPNLGLSLDWVLTSDAFQSEIRPEDA